MQLAPANRVLVWVIDAFLVRGSSRVKCRKLAR